MRNLGVKLCLLCTRYPLTISHVWAGTAINVGSAVCLSARLIIVKRSIHTNGGNVVFPIPVLCQRLLEKQRRIICGGKRLSRQRQHKAGISSYGCWRHRSITRGNIQGISEDPLRVFTLLGLAELSKGMRNKMSIAEGVFIPGRHTRPSL